MSVSIISSIIISWTLTLLSVQLSSILVCGFIMICLQSYINCSDILFICEQCHGCDFLAQINMMFTSWTFVWISFHSDWVLLEYICIIWLNGQTLCCSFIWEVELPLQLQLIFEHLSLCATRKNLCSSMPPAAFFMLRLLITTLSARSGVLPSVIVYTI